MAEIGQNDLAEWQEGWRAEDFSWSGLKKKPSWNRSGGSLQDFLRAFLHSGAGDDQLTQQADLIKCGRRGVFHVLFISPTLAKAVRKFPLTPEQLLAKQNGYWHELRSRLFSQTFAGQIAGAYFPEGIGPDLVQGTRASFAWVKFNGKIKGIPNKVDRRFGHCVFEQEVLIAEKSADNKDLNINFLNCLFQSKFEISDAIGIRKLEFSDTVFQGQFLATQACSASLYFYDCSLFTFDGDGCKYASSVTLFQCSVERRFECINCAFEDELALVCVTLKMAIVFTNCDFRGRAIFSDVDWPPVGQTVASAGGTKFYAAVSFEGDQNPPVQFFQDAEFASAVKFEQASERAVLRQFYAELLADAPDSSNKLRSAKRHCAQMENGCRTLRKLAETRGDVHQEQFWHRAEIIARRHRGESGRLERIFSRAYGAIADYGISIAMPFIWLVIVIVGFGATYAWLGGQVWFSSNLDFKAIEEGFGYSLNRTIPIGVFSDDENLWRMKLLGSGGQIGHIGIRSMATIQSILAAILIYLGVMAVRRKFRIS